MQQASDDARVLSVLTESPWRRPAQSPGRTPAHVRFGRLLVTTDLCVVIGTLAICLLIGWGFRAIDSGDLPRFVMILSFLTMWPIMLWQKQTRTSTILGSELEEYRRVLVASVWATCLVATSLYLTNTMRGRMFFIVVAVAITFGLLIERAVMRRVLLRRLSGKRSLHRLFVIADSAGIRMIRRQIAASHGMFGITGMWDRSIEELNAEELVAKARATGADSIVYVPQTQEDAMLSRQLAWAMERSEFAFFVSPALTDIAGPRLSVEPVRGMVMLRVDLPRFTGPTRVIKRAMDIVASLILLAVAGIPMLIIGILIRLDSKGPAHFKQQRAGVDGRIFTCWKFRTMSADADSQRDQLRAEYGDDGATFKLEHDPRVTRIGHFLRKYSIDELPQLVNVLRGDMGLVGPRPHPLDDVARYDQLALRRLLVKPGMTGLWQVSGRSDLSWDESVMLDLYYVENWSLALDVIILGRTLTAVLRSAGSY